MINDIKSLKEKLKEKCANYPVADTVNAIRDCCHYVAAIAKQELYIQVTFHVVKDDNARKWICLNTRSRNSDMNIDLTEKVEYLNQQCHITGMNPLLNTMIDHYAYSENIDDNFQEEPHCYRKFAKKR